MSQEKGVLVFGELSGGRLSAVTAELLGAGRCLANDLGEELAAVFLGQDLGDAPAQAVAWGADKVHVVNDPLLEEYQVDPFVAAMEQVCGQVHPNILLLGQTNVGRSLAPQLAFRLGTGLAMDCVELSIDKGSGQMLGTRPVYGGNARAVYGCPKTRPQMATVRAKAMTPLARDDNRQGQVSPLSVKLDASVVRAKVVQRVKQEAAGVKLEDAEVVVSGGRGIGGPEGFKQIEELAKLLKGAVGATRAACDAGWVPSTIQVGLTGKVVSPSLYIAVALSGSSQHMAGCGGSKTIVAVNKDPEANIFKEARFGVVGDYKQVLPAFAQKVKELQG